MSHPAAQPLRTHEEAPTRSIGEIVGDIAGGLSTLVRQEIALAKTELKEEAGKAGKGVGMLAGAGLAGWFTLLFLSWVLIFALDYLMPIVLAALIVTALWGIAAAVLASRGRKELKRVDPKLDLTAKTLKEDAEWLKTRSA
ncbi:phage holin family protein [Quadrisphaera sp. DSM 44207]|uniref:phage holin family protein n=1 Tax=Quadrisphaera sp. DSM 44207 TaxID=1881057 RepID=UPI000889947C|nr:phage holin family protein [Quadrisphaera sp. DSM 44207]SDQ47686.1 Putative Holin-X, holin superfamily III [Quadrisphaera sp. DSM 44207]